MAPILLEQQPPATLFAMSNPNINALSLSTRFTDAPSSQDATSGLKVVHIGKDMQPVTIVKMASINSQAWKKSACLTSLRTSVYNLVESHTVADLISLISHELPLDTGASFQAAELAANAIVTNICKVDHIEPVAFLNSAGTQVVISDPDDLDSRPADITFLRLRCTLDGAAFDKRITKVEPIVFQFCLSLPQHFYDTDDKTYEPITPIPASNRINTIARSVLGSFAAGETAPSTPPTNSNIASSPTASSIKSPVMKLFVSAGSSTNTSIKKGFYGPLTFLDSQADFDSTFGINPRLLPTNPSNIDSSHLQRNLRQFSDRCKLDIFLHLCMLDYVGSDSIDISLNVQEVCRKISSLCQRYTVRGKIVTDTPDELFDKFLVLSVSLPDDATTWPIQLCSTYLSALNSDLAEHVTTDASFSMPDLTTLKTKSLQIDALRSVRTFAVTSFRALRKQENQMASLLRTLTPHGLRGTQVHHLHSFSGNSSGHAAYGQSYFQNSQSLAEQTISRYNRDDAYASPVVETRIHPKTGLPHPFTRSTARRPWFARVNAF